MTFWARFFSVICLLFFSLNTLALELKARVTREEFAEFYGVLIIEEDYKDLSLDDVFSYNFNPLTGNINTDELFSMRSPYFGPNIANKQKKEEQEEQEIQTVHEFSLKSKPRIKTFKEKLLEADEQIKNRKTPDLSDLEKEAADNALNLSNIAKLYIKLNNNIKALELLKKASELAPDDYKILYTYGVTLYKNDQLGLAEVYLLKTTRIKPDFMYAHYNLGNLYYKKKAYKKALDSFKKAMELKPDKADIYFNIALTVEQLGYEEIAERFYRKALELNPGDDEAYKAIQRLNK